MPNILVSSSFMTAELLAYVFGATTCTLYRWLLWIARAQELFHTILARISLAFSTPNNFTPLLFY
jgi:hypothetical protein